MLTLRLTLNEIALLQQALQEWSQDHGLQQQQLDLLHKLTTAQNQAIRRPICPVCQRPFTQIQTGRTARYCSHACKQKAYRQRCNRAKKQFGPPSH